MTVDSFKFLPGSIAAYYRNLPIQREEPIPFTPLAKRLSQCRFALVTTAGIHQKGKEPPDYLWPQDLDEAKRDWQPPEPSPIIRMLKEQAARRGGS